MSFKLKTILGVALIEAVFLLLIVWSSVRYLEHTKQSELIVRANTVVETFANLTHEALLATDIARLESIAEQAIASPEFAYIRFIGQGSVLAEAGEPVALSRTFAADETMEGAKDGVFDVAVDVYHEDYQYGRVEVGLSIENAHLTIKEARNHLFGIALFEMLFVALFSYVLGSYLTRGLAGLRRGAENLAAGTMSETLPVRGRDELASTVEAFNKMFLELEKAKKGTSQTLQESREIAQKLFEQERKTTTILNTAIDGFLTFNQDGLIEEINHAGADLFDSSDEDLAGRRVEELFIEPFKSLLRDNISTNLYGFDGSVLTSTTETEGIRRDGSKIPLEIKISPIALPDRDIYVALLHDLSERNELKASTKRMIAMNEALVDASLDALVTIDVDNKIREFNPIAEKIFGYSRAEAIGKDMPSLIMPAHLRMMHSRGFEKYIATGVGPVIGNRIETEACRRNGEPFPVELTVQEINVEGERLFCAYLRDIADRKAAEQELFDAKSKAETASLAKSQFLAHMSHEIRSPLNAILGSLSLLMEGPLDSQQKTFAQTARSSSNNLLSLINDILDFSKIEAGELKVEPEAVDLQELIDESIDLVALKARDKNIAVGVSYTPDTPPGLMLDALRVRQIVVNLLDNAIKFTERGAVVIEVATVATTETTKLEISVTDSGIGIPKDEQDRLFEEFHQVDNTDVTRFGGTGLGLSISKKLARLMGGDITLESEAGRGACFKFSVTTQRDSVVATRHLDLQDSALKNKRILCVGFHPLVEGILSGEFARIGSTMLSRDTVQGVTADDLREVDVVFANTEVGAADLSTLASRARAAGIEDAVLVTANATSEISDLVAKSYYDFLFLGPITLERLVAQIGPGSAELALKRLRSTNKPGEVTLRMARGKRILVADDSPANLMIARAMLESEGYETATAKDGGEAVSKVENESFDLVLMDLRMPKVDGIEATKRIRRTGRFDDLPIVALTANAFKTDVKRCLDAGMNEFIGKPVKKEELLRVIRNLTHENDSADPQTVLTSGEEGPMTDIVDTEKFDSLMASLPKETGDKAFALFIEDAIHRADKIVLAAGAGDLPTIEHEAHTLKGMAASFGAIRLTELAQKIEFCSKEANLEALRRRVKDVRSIADETLNLLKSHHEQNALTE